MKISFPVQIARNRVQIIGLSVVGALLFVATYYTTIRWLFERYTAPESYSSHGFLIPFITGYFIFRRRKKLDNLEISHSNWGLFLVGSALCIHIFCQFAHIYFLSGFSILLLVFGACLFLFGFQLMNAVLVPMLYLMFMLPLPLILLQRISIPLKSLVTDASVGFTSIIGIQSVQKGFLILLQDGVIAIGDPCSGLRSLFSFLALGSVFLIDSQFSARKSVFFLLMCLAIALFSNMLRVVFLITVGNILGTQYVIEGTIYHDYSGFAVFGLGLVLMGLIWKAIR